MKPNKWLIVLGPTRPSVAFSFDLLNQASLTVKFGPMSQYAYARALRERLSIGDSPLHRPVLLPADIVLPWRQALYHWIHIDYLATQEIERRLFALTKVDFDKTRLYNICPPCFATSPKKDKEVPRMTTLSVDGNMQHFRWKMVSQWQKHEYTTDMFVPRGSSLFSTAPEVQGANNLTSALKTEVVEACGHSFKAEDKKGKGTKPVTMQAFDETGLMACMCRHGHPLRLLDIFRGENSESTLNLLHGVLQQCPEDAPVTICYDIACRFQGAAERLRKESPQKDIQFILNGFHAFAHELKCRLEFGPLQWPKIGLAQTESTETLWSKIMPLIVSGRRSSALHRTLMLEHVILHLATMMRRDMFKNLRRRWELATKQEHIDPKTKQKSKYADELDSLLSSLRISHPEKNLASKEDLTSFLRKQIEYQKEYFRKRPTVDYLSRDTLSTKFEIFESLRDEENLDEQRRQLEAKFQASALGVTAEVGAIRLTTELELAKVERTRLATVARTNELLASLESNRGEWGHDSANWTFLSNLSIIQEQDNLTFQINQEYGARLLEERDLHDRVRGQSAVKKLLWSFKRRIPKISNLIDKLDKLRSRIPNVFKTSTWSKSDFRAALFGEMYDKPFWWLEHDRDRLVKSVESARAAASGQPNPHILDCDWLWDEPAVSRGINALLHQDKFEEELQIIPKEARAAIWWLKEYAEAFQTYKERLETRGMCQYDYRIAWDILNMLEDATKSLKACPDLRMGSDVEELQGRSRRSDTVGAD